ncbi:MAG TPA: hypothetical protein PL169_16355 [Leptospiraceae bacterium]|nr:hypothetical protein [Leptospiraceae bacterium]
MNTLETFDALKKVNFTEEQSRELVRFFGKALEADPASRRDLSETELRLQKEIAEIRKETEGIRLEIQDVRFEIKNVEVKFLKEIEHTRLEIKNVEMKLSKEIEDTRLEIKELDVRGREAESRIIQTVASSKAEILKWVAGMLIANTGLIVALSKLIK